MWYLDMLELLALLNEFISAHIPAEVYHEMDCGYWLMQYIMLDWVMVKTSKKSTILNFQDQYDQIAVHTQKGIDFLEKYGHFVDARSKIEAEYASKLRWESLMGFRDDSKLYFIRLLPVIRGDNKTLKLNDVELQKVSIDESPADDHWTFELTWYETPFILRRLARNYLPKKKEEDDYQFTATKAFKLMLNEINDLAGQHEVDGTIFI